MYPRATVLRVVVTAGCASSPRPYDGVMGYEVSNSGGDRRVTYVDDAKVGREKTLGKIAVVCASLSATVPPAQGVTLESEQEYEKEVAFKVAIPSGMASTGTGMGMGGEYETRQAVSENHTAMRVMRLRKSVALCPR